MILSKPGARRRTTPFVNAENTLSMFSNALGHHLKQDPVSLIALRGASKTLGNSYAKPTLPKAIRGVPIHQRTLKPGGEYLRNNTSIQPLWRSIQESLLKKGYPTGGATLPGGGVGVRRAMLQMPDHVKIEYMKMLEKMYIAKAMGELYKRNAFTHRNRPFVPTNSIRLEHFYDLAYVNRGPLETKSKIQSYRQRTLLPVVAKGLASIPKKPRGGSRSRLPMNVN